MIKWYGQYMVGLYSCQAILFTGINVSSIYRYSSRLIGIVIGIVIGHHAALIQDVIGIVIGVWIQLFIVGNWSELFFYWIGLDTIKKDIKRKKRQHIRLTGYKEGLYYVDHLT
jgi:hypothetical protein